MSAVPESAGATGAPGAASAAGTAGARRIRDLDANALILALQAQRRQPRTTEGYWETCCALLRQLCRANATLVASGPDLLGGAVNEDSWLEGQLRAASSELVEMRQRALARGFAFAPLQDELRRTRFVAMVRASGLADTVVVLDIPERERAQLNELVMRALLAADFAGSAADDASAAGAGAPPATVASGALDTDLLDLLDLAARVMNEDKSGAATLALVNGLASHYGAHPVALGWLHGDAMRLSAVSNVDRFERNTRKVQLLEDSFLETLGHKEALWTDARQRDPLFAAHGQLREALGVAALAALQLDDAAGVPRAVLILGFEQEHEARPDLRNLQAMSAFLLPWLETLRSRDRWWGARLGAGLRQQLSRVTGPTHVWRKTLTALASALLLFILFGQWDYHIEAQSQLTTDATRLVSAQFDGRVDEVKATLGDTVKTGDVLLTLDTRDLRQQENDTRAELQRYEAEADKSRAAGNLAELGIARARHAQAQARLARVLAYLEQARAVAPFDAVVVDGERKNLINAPVKKGDTLYRVARVDGLYLELMVPEREIRHIEGSGRGTLRLLSRPDEPIPFHIETLIPVAQVKGQEGNHFLVKARLDQAVETWWRPGMSGIARIEGGRRNIAWILTHRLLDAVRLKFWWWLP